MIMFDSIDPSLLPDGYAYAGYTAGYWPNYSQIRGEHPGAHILSIAVTADDDAECLDVENGDATPGQAPGWHQRQRRRGVRCPAFYANASTLPAVITALRNAGISRRTTRLWSAHYTTEHICGPRSCAYPGVPACDATQWTSNARGVNLDQSAVKAGFFRHKPPPEPARVHSEDDDMYLPLIPGQPAASLTVWADTAAQGLPRAYRHVSFVVVGDDGAVVLAEFHAADGRTLGRRDYPLKTGREFAITPEKGTRVIRVARTDTTATAGAAVEVFRY